MENDYLSSIGLIIGRDSRFVGTKGGATWWLFQDHRLHDTSGASSANYVSCPEGSSVNSVSYPEGLSPKPE
jgi:hypothetical protein